MKLDENGTYWLGFFSLCAITVCVLIISIVVVNINETTTITDLIDKGFTPLEASCAIDSKDSKDSKDSNTCLVLAAGK